MITRHKTPLYIGQIVATDLTSARAVLAHYDGVTNEYIEKHFGQVVTIDLSCFGGNPLVGVRSLDPDGGTRGCIATHYILAEFLVHLTIGEEAMILDRIPRGGYSRHMWIDSVVHRQRAASFAQNVDRLVREDCRDHGNNATEDFEEEESVATKTPREDLVKVKTCKGVHVTPPRYMDRVKKIHHDEEKGVTVVFWRSGEKTIVRRTADDKESIYAAVAAAYMKRLFGSTSAFHRGVDDLATRVERKKKDVDAPGDSEVEDVVYPWTSTK